MNPKYVPLQRIMVPPMMLAPPSNFAVSACDDHSPSGLVGGLKGDAEQIITIHVTCIQAKH